MITIKRMQYQYVPAVKSDDFFKNLLAKLYESMTDTANSALRDLNDEYSERLETLTLGLTNQLRQVLGMRSAIQMPSNLSTLFRDMIAESRPDEKETMIKLIMNFLK